MPARVTPSELKFLVGRYRLALGKIGYSVISADGDAGFTSAHGRLFRSLRLVRSVGVRCPNSFMRDVSTG